MPLPTQLVLSIKNTMMIARIVEHGEVQGVRLDDLNNSVKHGQEVWAFHSVPDFHLHYSLIAYFGTTGSASCFIYLTPRIIYKGKKKKNHTSIFSISK